MNRPPTLRLITRLCTPLLILSLLVSTTPTRAQDTVTGAFEGTVTDTQTGLSIAGATVEVINQQTGLTFTLRSDTKGRFYQGLLAPGIYLIRVSHAGYITAEVLQRLLITCAGEVVPVPVGLEPVGPTPNATPTPSVNPTPSASATPVTPTPTASPSASPLSVEETEIRAQLSARDGRRSGSFTDVDLVTLPLGAITLTRTFDELALLLPGVAPPPQTIGNGSGPGVGAGVGSAGQFAVNGLRSRANNFTVDGSDNNDEDIGVRRQGFVALNSQPIESAQEYQIITLLAPAQFGRNIGAQVNAVSKSGGSQTHGQLYGFFNSSQLNSRNAFDTTNGTARTLLRAGNQAVLLDNQPLFVQNQSGGEDSFTFGQAGFVLGGPIKPRRIFYFIAAEGERTIASQEASFAVPTVEQRGLFRSGATGLLRDPFTGDQIINVDTGNPTVAVPSTRNGSAIFSLFPFPNNPQGVYGPNTFTQVLPASGQGKILAAKIDGNFKYKGRQQSITDRYNFTDDFRIIPVTGGALFSSLRPRVRTQNNSFFLNSEISALNSTRPMFNQVRLSYGRTRLVFEEIRDRNFLVPSTNLPNAPFLLNAPLLLNATTPPAPGQPNTGPATFVRDPRSPTVEDEIGPIGQVIVAGFSPIGVDVYNFPQERVNNTYQVADELTWRVGAHSLAFGADIRRSELNSDLPRNSRPLVTFNGGPRLIFENGMFRLPTTSDLNRFIRPEDLAALGAASNFYLTLNTTQDARNSLRYYQLNFYGQDAWRVRSNLSLSYGLRYEYNTPVRELNRRIEQTFTDPKLNLAPGLRQFIEGRTAIFDPDRNNFAPRVGLAYSLSPFGKDHLTVVRGGYGLYYDQILGAVVSQSRNVFPTFLTLNFGGLNAQNDTGSLTFFNPAATPLFVNDEDVMLVQPGTLNHFNPQLSLNDLFDFISESFPAALGATLPARRLVMPLAHQYSLTVEQQLGRDMFFTAAYVGTRGRNLLRFTTPNLGPGSTLVPVDLHALTRGSLIIPEADGRVRPPTRPVSGVGAINRFETSASSRYDALQLQVRGRLRRTLQYQMSYTLSKATDDVSDVFDLAGASALPQDSFNLAQERGPANFDARHRFTYQFIYDLPRPARRDGAAGLLLDGWQFAGTGRFQTGQPFTVNSIFDINLDGNLTDRLNTTNGIVVTGNRRQPLRLNADPLTLLAPIGQDGSVGRNTFRAGSVLELDMTVLKHFRISDRQSLTFRMDIFNFINRANYGIPVRYLEAPGFGQATNTVTPGRRVQFALKYSF